MGEVEAAFSIVGAVGVVASVEGDVPVEVVAEGLVDGRLPDNFELT